MPPAARHAGQRGGGTACPALPHPTHGAEGPAAPGPDGRQPGRSRVPPHPAHLRSPGSVKSARQQNTAAATCLSALFSARPPTRAEARPSARADAEGHVPRDGVHGCGTRCRPWHGSAPSAAPGGAATGGPGTPMGDLDPGWAGGWCGMAGRQAESYPPPPHAPSSHHASERDKAEVLPAAKRSYLYPPSGKGLQAPSWFPEMKAQTSLPDSPNQQRAGPPRTPAPGQGTPGHKSCC